jgi:hypothetical protein
MLCLQRAALHFEHFHAAGIYTASPTALHVHGEYRLDRCLVANVGTRMYVRSGTCIARTAVSERPASECADPYGDVQLAAGASIVGCTRVLPRCLCVPQRTTRARWCQARPIDATCGAAGSCSRSAAGLRAGTASLPRAVCRAAVRRRSSAASVPAHSALSVDRSRLAAHSYGNLCERHARTHSPASACVRCGCGGHRTPPAVGRAHGTARARGAQCAMRKAQVRTVAAAALGATRTHMHARAST